MSIFYYHQIDDAPRLSEFELTTATMISATYGHLEYFSFQSFIEEARCFHQPYLSYQYIINPLLQSNVIKPIKQNFIQGLQLVGNKIQLTDYRKGLFYLNETIPSVFEQLSPHY